MREKAFRMRAPSFGLKGGKTIGVNGEGRKERIRS